MLFFPQVLRKSAMHKVLANLCENSKTRSDLFNLLLGVLQEGSVDVRSQLLAVVVSTWESARDYFQDAHKSPSRLIPLTCRIFFLKLQSHHPTLPRGPRVYRECQREHRILLRLRARCSSGRLTALLSQRQRQGETVAINPFPHCSTSHATRP